LNFKINKEEMLYILNELLRTKNMSTCAAKKVACVLYSRRPVDGELVPYMASGYNKSVSSCQCNTQFQKIDGQWFFLNKNKEWKHDDTGLKHKLWSVTHEVHAEIMALTEFSDEKPYEEKLAVVTWSPCLDCCKSLINANVKTILYQYEFDNFEEIKELCKECNVDLCRFEVKNGVCYIDDIPLEEA